VVRFHGSIWTLQCADGCGAEDWEDLRAPLRPLPPRCPSCGGLARPGVVWFGEAIPNHAARAAQAATACDVFLSIGTSSLVYPAAALLDQAAEHGAFTVEINPEPTGSAGSVDAAVALAAEEALPLLEGAFTGSG
jgi:NAD-dependent deacetylase